VYRRTSGAVALLEFLLAAARARVVAADILEGIAHRFLRGMVAVRAVYMTMVVSVRVLCRLVVVRAVWAVDVGLLGHQGLLRNEIAGNYLTTAS
jgi:hypothetical protein